jgi:hypothetical protein
MVLLGIGRPILSGVDKFEQNDFKNGSLYFCGTKKNKTHTIEKIDIKNIYYKIINGLFNKNTRRVGIVL